MWASVGDPPNLAYIRPSLLGHPQPLPSGCLPKVVPQASAESTHREAGGSRRGCRGNAEAREVSG